MSRTYRNYNFYKNHSSSFTRDPYKKLKFGFHKGRLRNGQYNRSMIRNNKRFGGDDYCVYDFKKYGFQYWRNVNGNYRRAFK